MVVFLKVCALFNGRTNKSNARFTCPNCCIAAPLSEESRDKAKHVVKSAENLPRCKMSDELEKGLHDSLYTAYAARSLELGVAFDDVEKAGGLCVRVLSNVEKTNLVGEKMLQRYKFKEYPSEFPLRSKCIALFQKIHGVDTLLFAMYVYEYGDDCPAPNRRHVYISYLDSVRYFEPKYYRTIAYHSIIVEYLRYVKKRGYHTASIWSCPPVNGDDYIFYCHPKHQLVPREDMLRAWYHTMLDQAKAQGIVLSTSTLYDEYFSSDSENISGQVLTPTRLPYFEGDYIPGELEIIIQQCEANGDKISDVSSHDTVMVRLGHNLLKMKDNFIVVHLRNKRFVDAVQRGDDVSHWREDSDDDMVRKKRAKISAKLSPESNSEKNHALSPVIKKESFSLNQECSLIEAKIPTTTDNLSINTDPDKSTTEKQALIEQLTNVGGIREVKNIKEFEQIGDKSMSAGKDDVISQELKSPDATRIGELDAMETEHAEIIDVSVDISFAVPVIKIDEPFIVEQLSHGAVKAINDETCIDHAKSALTGEKPVHDESNLTGNFDALSGKVSSDTVVDAINTDKIDHVAPLSPELLAVAQNVSSATDKLFEHIVAETSQITSTQLSSNKNHTTTNVVIVTEDLEPARKRALNDFLPAAENHISGQMNSNEKVSDTIDDDPPMESEMFESRQQFLNYCQSAHCQFDELRRAKHSTVMVLFQLHNPSAPKFLQQCGACYRDITHGVRHHCKDCSNFDLCEDCYEPIISGTLAKRDPRFAHDEHHSFTAFDMETTDDSPKSQADRQNSLKAHVQILEHAAFCGGPPACSLHNCDRFKKIFLHCSDCDIKPKRDCKICTRLLVLCTMHSRLCNSRNLCPVPFCDRIRDRNKRLYRQQQLMDDRRRRAQNELYHAGGEN